ncbi:hypothetical protein RN001_004938 [Aquatica leii]|uniref:DUF4806 domain-containing protein n=1 Tax=Aquatica leii TaxID=1421715 RepID=A0AAN7PC03_9COLE|nr:hypothetical protein RN001_004938 [Aquatica leii]
MFKTGNIKLLASAGSVASTDLIPPPPAMCEIPVAVNVPQNEFVMNIENADLEDDSKRQILDLLLYHKRLFECERSQKQLETVFNIYGGVSEKENIIRGLQKIFTDKLVKECSWLGRKNNYAVYNLKLISILKEAENDFEDNRSTVKDVHQKLLMMR